MVKKIKLAVGFFAGLGIAYWLKVVSAQYLWVLFYR